VDFSIRLSPSDFSITAYVDASFAIHKDGMGHTGINIHMGPSESSGLLYCQSSKQKLLGMHSTECELIALNDAIFTILRIKQLTLFLGIAIPPIRVFQDNQSAMQIALKGGGDIRKTKYMRVRVNNVTNEIKSGLIFLEYIPTKLMIADVLTKPLYSTLFTTLSHRLLNISIGDPEQLHRCNSSRVGSVRTARGSLYPSVFSDVRTNTMPYVPVAGSKKSTPSDIFYTVPTPYVSPAGSKKTVQNPISRQKNGAKSLSAIPSI
jgi:hypothetical protein